MSTTVGSHCELEELAAFVDGRLAGAARTAVVAHLADCDRCREIVAETILLSQELGQGAPTDLAATAAAEAVSAEEPPSPRRARILSFRVPLRLALPLAAAAALVLAVAFWLTRPPASFLGEVSPASWSEHPWSVVRDAAKCPVPPWLTPEQRAFRIGVHAVELEAAVAWQDRRAGGAAACRIAVLLDEDDLLTGPFAALGDGFGDEGVAFADLREDVETILPILAEEAADPDPRVEPRAYALGKWTAQRRLAALSGRDEVFDRAFGLAFRLDLRRQRAAAPELAPELDRLAALVHAELDARRRAELAEVFAEVEKKLGG